jgi:DegV family protein with EDD domain
MANIAVVTDSSAYLPADVIKEYGIHVVPLNVQFNGSIYKDLVDITVEQFFQKLATAPELPSTSQPSAGEFAEAFEKAAKGHDGVIAVLLSAALSGTYSSAMAAKEMLPNIPIAVVDSRSVSMGLGFQVLAAARAARQGKSLEEIVAIVEPMIPKMRVWFVVDTLKYLAKGGRIGGGEAFLGTMLSIKPLLQVENGKVEALDKVRTRGKAVERLMELCKKDVNGGRLHCAVINAMAKEDAEQLKQQIVAAYPNVQDMMVADVSPVIGTHVGPGTIGICFYAE